METVGEFFKQVRETKGLTLDDVASKTRIRTDFLQALEDGNFSKLPDQVFAKGFVRTYARSLGLDEDDAMYRFTQSAGAFYDKQEERERLRVKQVEEERRRRTSRKTLVLAVGVALLVLVLLLSREQSSMFFSGGAPALPPASFYPPTPTAALDSLPTAESSEAPVEHSSATVPTQEPTEQPALEPAPPVQRPAPTSVPHEAIEESSAIQVSIPDDPLGGHTSDRLLTLDLEALELTWVVVQIDGGSPHEALLRAGERVSWKGNEQFTLTLGNAGGVKVELNGDTKGPFGPSGTVARDIVLKLE